MIKSRQVLEKSDHEVLVRGNVPQTASQTASIDSFAIYLVLPYISIVNVMNTIMKQAFHNFTGPLVYHQIKECFPASQRIPKSRK